MQKYYSSCLLAQQSELPLPNTLQLLNQPIRLPHAVRLPHAQQLPHAVRPPHAVPLPHAEQQPHVGRQPHAGRQLHVGQKLQFDHHDRLPHAVQKPKKPKKQKPPRKLNPSHAHSSVGFAPVKHQPPRIQQSAIRDNIDAFVDDLLQPFMFGPAPAAPTKATTTTPRTTVKHYIGGSSGPQTLTGYGAPSKATSGSCKIAKPMSNTIYVSMNSAHAKSTTCGRCVFIWCPSFGGCKGSPLQKAQIVDIFDGKADIAMSKGAFKIVVGKEPTKDNQKSIFMGMWNIISC